MDGPYGLTFSGADLYIAELEGNRVRKVDHTNGHISTVAGTGSGTASGDGGAATAAGVPGPSAIAFDGAGDMFIAQSATGAQTIREVDHQSGDISTVAGGSVFGFAGDKGGAEGAGFFRPTSIVIDPNDDLYVSDGSRIRRIVGPL